MTGKQKWITVLYLWCFIGDDPAWWMDRVSWAEYCYNTNYHSSVKPPSIWSGLWPFPTLLALLLSRPSSCGRLIWNCRIETCFCKICENVSYKPRIMKTTYDSRHREIHYEVGGLVLLKLQPYRQLSLVSKSNRQIIPSFLWPLSNYSQNWLCGLSPLSSTRTKIQPVFHVSCSQIFHGPTLLHNSCLHFK